MALAGAFLGTAICGCCGSVVCPRQHSGTGLKRAGLGALDRWLGVIFGLVRGYVIVVLTYAVAVVIMEGETNLPKQVGEAAFNPYVQAMLLACRQLRLMICGTAFWIMYHRHPI